MNRSGGQKLELICVVCNEPLADLEKACASVIKSERLNKGNDGLPGQSGYQSKWPSCDVARITYPQPHYGGYMPLTDLNPKHVVVTKCGHMFHQGCLRQHVHKSLMEGKGGSLYCPICTRPFAMNRLWPVNVPPTKVQRDRYVQLILVKEQNAEMVQQLKDLRAKITEEEESLRKIKEDADQFAQDIQQKQKLLESVNGPTNDEIAELTKMNIKRQEILHVVTQHNADLLKLLAEESNVSNNFAAHVETGDQNHNHIQPTEIHAGLDSIPEESTFSRVAHHGKKSKRGKKDKSKRQHSKKRHERQSSLSGATRHLNLIGLGLSDMEYDQLHNHRDISSTGRDVQFVVPHYPSEMIPTTGNTSLTSDFRNAEEHFFKSRKVEPLAKWKMDSLSELMALRGISALDSISEASSLSRASHSQDNKRTKISSQEQNHRLKRSQYHS